MSTSPANSASINDGPALNTLVLNFDGLTARSNSPDDTPSTACACVRFAKYPSRTSFGGGSAAWPAPPSFSLLHPPLINRAATSSTKGPKADGTAHQIEIRPQRILRFMTLLAWVPNHRHRNIRNSYRSTRPSRRTVARTADRRTLVIRARGHPDQ